MVKVFSFKNGFCTTRDWSDTISDLRNFKFRIVQKFKWFQVGLVPIQSHTKIRVQVLNIERLLLLIESRRWANKGWAVDNCGVHCCLVEETLDLVEAHVNEIPTLDRYLGLATEGTAGRPKRADHRSIVVGKVLRLRMELYIIALVSNWNLDHLGYRYLWRLTCDLIYWDGNATILNVAPIANNLLVKLKVIARNHNSCIAGGRALIRLNIGDSARCIVEVRCAVIAPILVIPFATV